MFLRTRAVSIGLFLFLCLASTFEISVPKAVPHDEPDAPGGSGGSGEPGAPDTPSGGTLWGPGTSGGGETVGGPPADEPKFELSDLLDLTNLLSLTGLQTPHLP